MTPNVSCSYQTEKFLCNHFSQILVMSKKVAKIGRKKLFCPKPGLQLVHQCPSPDFARNHSPGGKRPTQVHSHPTWPEIGLPVKWRTGNTVKNCWLIPVNFSCSQRTEIFKKKVISQVFSLISSKGGSKLSTSMTLRLCSPRCKLGQTVLFVIWFVVKSNL